MSFFDMFGPLFDPSEGANRSDRQRSSNDDPIILNVETDGDTTSRSVLPVRVLPGVPTDPEKEHRAATRFSSA